ncbi:MAG: cytochrome C biogenesis protein [Candidatus Omnitrophica bacterium]|nr:cytochrome C biogenesis protein [Candidatus Omnitrophota bacterium]MCM8777755.1 cytochrome C biogenesis protein [Candidatus Omnitrophota bacterium]
MQNIFAFLTRAVEGNPLISIIASFLWGILSILLSPCHLVSIPLIVGFITQQGVSSTRKAFKLSLIFSLGIFLTIAIVGIITSLLGKMAGDIGKLGNYIVASVLLIVGLYLLDIIKIPGFKGINQPALKHSGTFTAFLLGLIFGTAMGPCTFAYMAPILAVIFKVSGTQFLYGILLILVYAAGHCSVIVIAGTSVEFVEKCVRMNERSKVVIIKKICGLFVILAGLYIFWSA